MLKSKKYIILGIIIVVLLITGILLIAQSKKDSKDRVMNMYNKLVSAKKYTFSMEEKTENNDYRVSMIQRDADYAIDTYSDDTHTTTLVLGNKIYYLMHNNQEYYALEEDDETIDLESDIYVVENGLKNLYDNEYNSGKERISGKEYYYEEFDNENMYFLLFADTNETSTVKIRFYFDKDNLAYIKNIIIDEDGQSEELIKVQLKYEVDENLLKIPDEYAETDDWD